MTQLGLDDSRHGKASTYVNWKCRCEQCRAAWRDYCREKNHRTGRNRPMHVWRNELAQRSGPPHGTESRNSRGCRCADCPVAAVLARRARRLANPEAARAYDRAYKSAHRKRSVGDFDQALIRRAEELAVARAAAEGELAELTRQQELDERFGDTIPRRPWLLSLDARDRYGRELLETLVVAA